MSEDDEARTGNDGAEATRKSSRAKARWDILRAALLGNQNIASSYADGSGGGMNGVSSASIHRFEGFQMLDRRVLSCSDGSNENDAKIIRLMHQTSNADGIRAESKIQYECVEYSVDVPLRPNEPHTSDGVAVKVRTRERKRNADQRVDINALLSHRHHGVDNTGQARVWDSESTLTHCLLRGSMPRDSESSAAFPLGIDSFISLAKSDNSSGRTLRVIELGAGMAGLAGLSLAALGMSNQLQQNIKIDVTLTDGHPEAVENNRICSMLTSDLYNLSEPQNVSCQRLLWNDGEQGAKECNGLTMDGACPYHLCLASDCTHFQEFHAALAATIGRLLSVGGICILCQPKRANSLDRFMVLIDVMNEAGPVFDIKLYEQYDDRLWKMHNQYMSKETRNAAKDRNIYEPSIHYPLLLVVKKTGDYVEKVHTAAASRHMRERENVSEQ